MEIIVEQSDLEVPVERIKRGGTFMHKGTVYMRMWNPSSCSIMDVRIGALPLCESQYGMLDHITGVGVIPVEILKCHVRAIILEDK